MKPDGSSARSPDLCASRGLRRLIPNRPAAPNPRRSGSVLPADAGVIRAPAASASCPPSAPRGRGGDPDVADVLAEAFGCSPADAGVSDGRCQHGDEQSATRSSARGGRCQLPWTFRIEGTRHLPAPLGSSADRTGLGASQRLGDVGGDWVLPWWFGVRSGSGLLQEPTERLPGVLGAPEVGVLQRDECLPEGPPACPAPGVVRQSDRVSLVRGLFR
jgi:hypothetical protein